MCQDFKSIMDLLAKTKFEMVHSRVCRGVSYQTKCRNPTNNSYWLMEDILHHLGCPKMGCPKISFMESITIISGTLSSARFFPSTVSISKLQSKNHCNSCDGLVAVKLWVFRLTEKIWVDSGTPNKNLRHSYHGTAQLSQTILTGAEHQRRSLQWLCSHTTVSMYNKTREHP